jgi:hypothetical protein
VREQQRPYGYDGRGVMDHEGLTASQAITRVQQAMSDWLTEKRKQILAKYEEIQRKKQREAGLIRTG